MLAFAVLHVGTAAWIGYGAFMKATEFNPNLLPGPILSLLQWVMKSTSVDPEFLLTWALRSIIGAEVAITLCILASTRYARIVAILTLSLFCAILAYAMATTAMKDGVLEALTGGCGCFGKQSLPASAMFAIDALLLANALFLVPRRRAGSPALLAIPLVIGLATTFFLPEPDPVTTDSSQTQSQSQSPSQSPKESTTSSQPQTAAQSSASDAGTASATPASVSGPWPGAPAKYEKIYFPKWKDWVGQPLRDQKLARAIEGPMPDDFEKGDWLVVFSRADCEDCQSMYRASFNQKRPERVLKVTVPDSRGTPLAMPCVDCESRMLYRVKAGETGKGKSPEYVFRTPVIVRMKDGIVTGVCTDRAIPEEYNAVFPDSDSARAAASTTKAEAEGAAAGQTPPPAAPAWPGPPDKLASFYVAEFDKAVGKPLADLPFARLIENRLPPDFLAGRWVVVFYREDCDHCYELLGSNFTGKLKHRTLTVAIPDADPNNILGNPCDDCVKLSLLKGPNYVIATPVVLAIKDGVVECVVENVDDMAALEACLQFK